MVAQQKKYRLVLTGIFSQAGPEPWKARPERLLSLSKQSEGNARIVIGDFMKKILLTVAAAVAFSAAVFAQNSPKVTYIKSPEFKNQIYLYGKPDSAETEQWSPGR